MPTRAEGVAAGVREIVDRARALARLEAELAVAELRDKAGSLGVGAALLAASALLALFAIGFLLATFAAALATFLPTWLALLAVGLLLLLAGGVAGAVGVAVLRRGSPPVPEQAIAEAKLTGAALTGNGRA